MAQAAAITGSTLVTRRDSGGLRPRPHFADLADLGEDYRIKIIGETVLKHRKVVSFVTDAKPPSKVDRYIKKLLERYPGVVVLERLAGPGPDAVSVKVGPSQDVTE